MGMDNNFFSLGTVSSNFWSTQKLAHVFMACNSLVNSICFNVDKKWFNPMPLPPQFLNNGNLHYFGKSRACPYSLQWHLMYWSWRDITPPFATKKHRIDLYNWKLWLTLQLTQSTGGFRLKSSRLALTEQVHSRVRLVLCFPTHFYEYFQELVL